MNWCFPAGLDLHNRVRPNLLTRNDLDSCAGVEAGLPRLGGPIGSAQGKLRSAATHRFSIAFGAAVS